jgi:hypothetical protein
LSGIILAIGANRMNPDMEADPISFRREGDVVSLVMSGDNYGRMMIALGYNAGLAEIAGDVKTFWSVIRFVNHLNAGNPDYAPYEIPEEFLEN